MWGRIWRWTLTAVVVFSGYVFLSYPAVRGFEGSEWETHPVFWIHLAFVLIGPIAIGMAVYSFVDDHQKQRRELANSLRTYLQHKYPNGRQRWYEAEKLVRILSWTIEWIKPTSEFMDEMFSSTSIERPQDSRGEPCDVFLDLSGRSDIEEYVPCGLSTAAIGIDEMAPEWAMTVRAFGRPDYKRGDPIVTIGELAVSARNRLHDGILQYADSDRYPLQRHVWAHLLSDTCEVVLPEETARRLSLPSGSTFGFATRTCAWNLTGLVFEPSKHT